MWGVALLVVVGHADRMSDNPVALARTRGYQAHVLQVVFLSNLYAKKIPYYFFVSV